MMMMIKTATDFKEASLKYAHANDVKEEFAYAFALGVMTTVLDQAMLRMERMEPRERREFEQNFSFLFK